jgi:hypothetical protein
VTTFPSTGEEHANNVDRCRRNPAKLFGHSEIVTDCVVFGDGTPGDPEPVGLRGSKSPSVGRKRVGHSSVGRIMHHKRSMLTGVQGYTGDCAVSRDKHFMKFEAHLGKRPCEASGL